MSLAVQAHDWTQVQTKTTNEKNKEQQRLANEKKMTRKEEKSNNNNNTKINKAALAFLPYWLIYPSPFIVLHLDNTW